DIARIRRTPVVTSGLGSVAFIIWILGDDSFTAILSLLKDGIRKLGKPLVRSLLETIKGFMEVTHRILPNH
ncbi:hypothetical protein DVH24_006971, partial [Malus domestica]